MTKKQHTIKLVPALGHIVFPQKGPVRKVVNPLPDKQEELECVIMQKFAGALNYFKNRNFIDIRKSDPWPDFIALEGEVNWGIELIELVDPKHAKGYQLRQRYLEKILNRLGGIPGYLNGIDLLISDDYQKVLFPPVNTSKGDKIISTILDEINAISEALRRLPPNGRLTVDLSDKQDIVPHLKLYCTRFASAESEGLFHFLDSFPILKDDANRLLERAVISKLDKHYQRSQEYRLLLLIYELQMISVERNGVALDYARNVLRNCKHPFKEVWYFSPYADKDMGFIIKVWPI